MADGPARATRVAPSADAPASYVGAPPPRWAAWAVAATLLLAALDALSRVRVIDIDLFHEMALFREALALGRIPTADVFAYTPTVSPVVHHEWGTGAVLYLITVELGLGATGLVLLRLLLLAGTVACCVAVARRRGAGGVEMAVVAPLAILLFTPGLSPVRAHMFTFLLLAFLLWLLELERAGARKWLLLWPPAFVLWLNLHGGFVVGAGMLGLYTGERFLREARRRGWRSGLDRTGHLWAACAVTVPLLLVNPYGADYVPYIWHALLLDRPFIPEWAPLWDAEFRGPPLILFSVSVLFVLYSVVRGDGWGRLPGLPMLLVAAAFALKSVRILPIYVVVWAAYMPAALSGTPLVALLGTVWGRWARPLGALAMVAAVLAAGRLIRAEPFTLLLPGAPSEEHPHAFPVGAVAYLSEIGFRGNLMTPFGFGAYVSWHLHPDVKVGMDSRYEVAYPPELVEETILVYGGSGDWREFLDRHGTDAVLVPRTAVLASLLTEAASSDPSSPWTEVYGDDAYAVFARDGVADGMPRRDRSGQPVIGGFP